MAEQPKKPPVPQKSPLVECWKKFRLVLDEYKVPPRLCRILLALIIFYAGKHPKAAENIIGGCFYYLVREFWELEHLKKTVTYNWLVAKLQGGSNTGMCFVKQDLSIEGERLWADFERGEVRERQVFPFSEKIF